MAITEEDIQRLTTCTSAFMNHVHVVQQSFNLLPDKLHHGTCINYIDLQEFREEFCSELVYTIPGWVYSQKQGALVLNKLLLDNRNEQNARTAFVFKTLEKFRNRDSRELFIQGQFGELLLFNFIQSLFSAVPLLRKMPITTSTEMERFGADAIHYSFKNGKNVFYLGEAKTYSSEYKFAVAIKDAIGSILKTYKEHRKELGLYVYDSFIDEDLQAVASSYKNGTISNAEIHLVSIVTYCENENFAKNSEKQIKEDIINIISERGRKLDRATFDVIEPGLLPRLNYIILPVWQLDELLSAFQRLIGK